MKILLVKTSSLGDVAHTLTAIREAKQQRPELVIDWLVEAAFSDVAELAKQDGHIHQIIPINFRQWRKQKPLVFFYHPEIKALKQRLQAANYDLVLDAQGLFKSVYLARLAAAPISGLDKQSARESWASYAYQQRYRVPKNQHAIHRLRQLFSQAFNYELPDWQTQQNTPYSGKPVAANPSNNRLTTANQSPTILLVHATTWDNKHYPVSRWRELVQRLTEQGYQILLPQYTQAEYDNAMAIAEGFSHIEILPKQSIQSLICTMQTVSAVVSVDTGLAHLSSYLGIPTVVLFGPTNSLLTGVIGINSQNLSGQAACAPCMKRHCYHQADTTEQQQQPPCMTAIDSEAIVTSLASLVPKNK